ncbi:MAG TPA: HD domain-containing phosphohydrolase [Gemmataceae bacterium]
MNLPPLAPSPQSSRSVLVVDDEPAVRGIVARWLRAEGYHCREAGSAAEALRALEEEPFALVFTDLRMPGASGLDLLRETGRRHPEAAVVLITAVDDRGTAARAIEGGAYGYIIKPFERNELLISAAGALERRRLRQASREYQRRLEAEVRQRTAEIRRREEEIAVRLVSASGWRDSETGAHVRRIGQYSATLAAALGWEARAVDDIRLAAAMHDVGKIGIPDSILRKPGRLTDDEFRLMQRHTVIGAELLGGSEIPLLAMARSIARSHHERWDGFGYPDGLEAGEIPPAARIVAIADVYDALVHRRVYKPALPEEEALAVMTAQSGRHFDPHIFEKFLEVLPEFRRIRRELREPGPSPAEASPALATCPAAV